MKNFKQAAAYIESFINFEKIRHPERGLMKIARVRKLLHALGNPQKSLRTVHLAGTKGKGSTAAFCQSVLCRAGLRTGMFTSPHLHNFTERIRIDHRPIGRKAFTEITERIREIILSWPDRDELSFFEILAAMAFVHFDRNNVDAAVIEAGLGGRLDATNVLEPGLIILTPVSLDHTAILGSTVSHIAKDKAAVIKPGSKVILCPQNRRVRKIYLDECKKYHVPVHEASRHWYAENIRTGVNGTVFDFHAEKTWFRDMRTRLCGAHQAHNAAAALAAAMEFLGPRQLNETIAAKGIAACHWPGRLQRFAGTPDIWVDGAHNRASARIVRDFVEKHIGSKIILVFAVSAGKPAGAMIDVLKPVIRSAVCTQTANARARSSTGLARLMKKRIPDCVAAPDTCSALRTAKKIAGPDTAILVCGSLFLAAEAITCLSG